ncbi:PDR/VanB family oxidoreductase [Stenotrophomonas lacuserhaii]|uniref:PDR/VanB family oxidoreductase n=1 Tax=Stenotrophomonas lacuserhaii TaxID=2760084 RepID=UPI0032EE5880
MNAPLSDTSTAFPQAAWQATFVSRLQRRSSRVIVIELAPATALLLAGFTAGAHVDLALPDARVRSYSLMNAPEHARCYQLGILLAAEGRGGSHYLHTQLREGDSLQASLPRNAFPLHEPAENSVLIAGGIGITPLLCMARHLAARQRPVHLYYSARSRQDAVFLHDLTPLGNALTCLFDDECGGPPDLLPLLAAHPPDTHFYCCGPGPMLDAFGLACRRLGITRAHVERFSAPSRLPGSLPPKGYDVVLARSRTRLHHDGQGSLLDFLLRSGVAIPNGCHQGVCGSCATRVVSGEVDHRDGILSEHERQHSSLMLPCVSGCRGTKLELDI